MTQRLFLPPIAGAIRLWRYPPNALSHRLKTIPSEIRMACCVLPPPNPPGPRRPEKKPAWRAFHLELSSISRQGTATRCGALGLKDQAAGGRSATAGVVVSSRPGAVAIGPHMKQAVY